MDKLTFILALADTLVYSVEIVAQDINRAAEGEAIAQGALMVVAHHPDRDAIATAAMKLAAATLTAMGMPVPQNMPGATGKN